LDALLGGGLGRGTSALLLGPPGAGKSALVMQYAFSRLKQGDAVACFVFEESRERFLNRAAGFGRELPPWSDVPLILRCSNSSQRSTTLLGMIGDRRQLELPAVLPQ